MSHLPTSGDISSSDENHYLAGVCNIGPAEIRKRQTVAILGLVLIALGITSLHRTHAPHLARLSIFIPALVFSVGFVQSRKKFCLAFGFMGTFNFGKSRDLARVVSAQDRARDRKTALVIFGQSALLAAAITLLVIVLPL
jgi:uncharacterized membrane protein